MIILPEYIHTFVSGRQFLIRTTDPHYIGEVVAYSDTDEMLRAVALLNTKDTPYFINTKRNIAIIFAGAMGKVRLHPAMHHEIREVTYTMGDFYLKNF